MSDNLNLANTLYRRQFFGYATGKWLLPRNIDLPVFENFDLKFGFKTEIVKVGGQDLSQLGFKMANEALSWAL